MFRLYPYKVGSASVKALKESLNALIIKTENSKYRYRPNHFIINWGNSRRPVGLDGVLMLNAPESVAVTANKLDTLLQLRANEVPTLRFTTDREEAEQLLAGGNTIFVRNKLNGHSGEGIEVVKPTRQQADPRLPMLERVIQELIESGYDYLAEQVTEEMEDIVVPPPVGLNNAPLYTVGIDNRGEYRVHVVAGEVILYQKKSRRVDIDGVAEVAEGVDADVRNLETNWIYRTGNLKKLERVEELAVNAIEALNLDFGAVDIIMDDEGDIFVLEVNSAPGLGNADSLEAYTEAFNKLNN